MPQRRRQLPGPRSREHRARRASLAGQASPRTAEGIEQDRADQPPGRPARHRIGRPTRRDGALAIEAHAPPVTVAIGGAVLNAMRPPAAFSGGGPTRMLPTYRCSDRIEQPARPVTNSGAERTASGERHRVAAAGKTNVEHGQVGELDAKAAGSPWQAGAPRPSAAPGFSAGLRDARIEAARS